MPTPSTDPVETELKFALGPGARQTLQAGLLRGAQTWSLAATYFDTPDHALFASGYVLRVRRKGDRFIQTLKSDGDGLFARGEWESEAPSANLDAAALSATPAADIARVDALQPLFEVNVVRSARVIAYGASRIEAVLDVGEVWAGDAREAVEELELELIDGAPGDLFGLARTLDAPVTLAFETKSERGYRLAGVGPPERRGPLAALRQLSDAVRAEDSRGAREAAAALGVAVSNPPDAGFDRARWAGVLLDAAERVSASGADTTT